MARRRHNTQTARDRRKLVESFESRIRYDEEQGNTRHWLPRPYSFAWVVHLLADDTDLLAGSEATAEQCVSADAYWRYRDSVAFVQFHGRSFHTGDPGIWYRFDREYRQDDFDVYLPTAVVTSADLHRAFAILEDLTDRGVVDAARAELQEEDGRWVCREEPLAPFGWH